MIRIIDEVFVEASINDVFDAERNISLHAATQSHRGEQAVGGRTSGLIELGEEVEWEAVHFGIRQRLRVRITQMERPRHFRDEMMSGAFKSMVHDHYFEKAGEKRTLKRDVMVLEAPLGPLGWTAEVLFLRAYMSNFLTRKNRDFKRMVEGFAGASPVVK